MKEHITISEMTMKMKLFGLCAGLSLIFLLGGGLLWIRPITEAIGPATCGWLGFFTAGIACFLSRLLPRSVVRFFSCLGLLLGSLVAAGLGWWLLLTVTIWAPIVIALVGEGRAQELEFTNPLHKLAAALCQLSFPICPSFLQEYAPLAVWYIGLTLLIAGCLAGGFYWPRGSARYRPLRRATAVALFLFNQLWMLPLVVHILIANS